MRAPAQGRATADNPTKATFWADTYLGLVVVDLVYRRPEFQAPSCPGLILRICAIAKLTSYFACEPPRTQPAQEGRNRVHRTTNIYEGGLNKEEANAETKNPPKGQFRQAS